MRSGIAMGAQSNAHGVLPFKELQLRSLMETLQTVPDPRKRRSSFRIGSVLGITAMALLKTKGTEKTAS